MDILFALTLAAKLADLAIDAINGIAAAATAYAKVRPVIDAMIREGRDPTPEEWRTLNALLDNAVNHLLED